MKRMLSMLIASTAVILLLVASAYASEADAILGKWSTEGDESIVEIYPCAGFYCGKIVWMKEPKNSDGTEKMDSRNQDPAQRSRKVMGMDIVWGFKCDGNDAWSGAKIYDPKNGKTYSCSAKLDKDKLYIRGFIGVSLLGRTTVWRRTQ